MSILSISEIFVVRSEDESLFNIKKFRIYKFNTPGFSVIQKLLEEGMTLEACKLFAESKGIIATSFEKFIDRCINEDIIKVTRAEVML